jgi:hypothetical protein
MWNKLKCCFAAKKVFLLSVALCLSAFVANAQKPKQPSKAEMDKMMDDAFKKAGMSKEDAAAIKDVMKGQGNKPAAQQTVNLNEILKDNKQLIPAKNNAKINALRKQYTTAEVSSTVNNMYTKLLAKGDAKQIAMAKKAMEVAKTCTALMDAANTAMLQGQTHTALLLSLKAVQTCSSNLVAQNNLAALLTQYGYPEKAIPFLQKINAEDKGNSTVLNNLAYAWLGLGETEKAYQFAYGAVMRNPQHPQSRLCAGIILEQEGKTAEAKQQIEIAKKFNGTKITNQIAKNNGGNTEAPKMSWAEVKKKISIYEYFPKGWRKTYIPPQNNIDYYNAYQSDMLSDQRMREAFIKKMSELINAQQKVIDAEMNDKAGMLKKVMQSGMADKDGFLNIVVNIRFAIGNAFHDEYLNNWQKQIENFRKYRNEQDRNVEGLISCTHRYSYSGTSYSGHNTESGKKECDQNICKVNTGLMNTERNKRMKEYNTQFIAFSNEIEEDFRFYWNAMMTWYLIDNSPALKSGNQLAAYNFIQTFFNNNYGFNSNVRNLYFQSSRVDLCKSPPSQNSQLTVLPHPEIPNLNCPVIFKIPSGFGSLNIGAGVSAGSDNEYGITANNSNRAPSMSSAFSTSGKRIAEPGIFSDSYVNSDGSVIDPNLGGADEYLEPLTSPKYKNPYDNKYDEALEPLPKPSKVNSNWDDDELVPLVPKEVSELRNARATIRKLLNESMSKTCINETTKNKNKQDEFLKKAAALDNELDQEAAQLQQKVRNTKYDDEELSPLVKAYDDEELVPLTKANEEKNVQKIKRKYGEMKTALKEAMDNSGLTTTLNNGLSLPGKIAGFVEGLFN